MTEATASDGLRRLVQKMRPFVQAYRNVLYHEGDDTSEVDALLAESSLWEEKR